MSTHDDGLTSVNHFGNWITSADTKAALIAGGIAIVTGTALDRPALRAALDADDPGRIIALCLFTAVVVSLVVTVLFLGLTLIPRTPRPNGGPNRYAFPHVAVTDQVVPDEGDPTREAWQQANTLADIADIKFQWLRRAFTGFGISLAFTVAWMVAATIVGGTPQPG